MTIQDIYSKYQVPSNLQRHMLQVTAVGQYIVEHWIGPTVDSQLITLALLLHDMGSIVKFKTPFLGEMAKDEEYWLKVQADFVKKYGKDPHVATEQIVREIISRTDKILTILQAIGFNSVEKYGYQNWESRISDHADMCVSPQGIVTFEERITDLIKRYQRSESDIAIKLRRENAKKIQENVDVGLESIKKVDFSVEIESLKKTEISLV